MKKWTLMAVLLSLSLVAYGSDKVEGAKEVATQTVEQVKELAIPAEFEVITFQTADGETYTLESSDSFGTATLKNAGGETFSLKKEAAKSGNKLVDENNNKNVITFDTNTKKGNLNLNGKEYDLNIVD